jgi:tetratricopeptide (TPR) repeat protein
MTHFLGTYGYWTERVVRGRYALEAARCLADKRAVAWLNLNTLGWVYLKRGDYEEARACVEESLSLYEGLSDWEGLVHAYRYLGIVAIEQGELDTAEEINKKALDIAKSKCTEETVFTFYSNFGDLALRRGDYAEAEQWYEEARKGLEKVGSRSRLSSRLIDLGIAKLKQEKLNEARDFYEKGLALSQEVHRPDNIVSAKLGLAMVYEKHGNRADALKLAHESLEMAERLGIRRESEQARALVARLERKLSAD